MKLILDAPHRENGLAISQQLPTSSQVATHSSTGKQAKKQILVLDGVRAIACLVVLSYHMSILIRDYRILPPLQDTNPLTPILNSVGAFFAEFGESGVILFFVLSGFLLFLPYAKALLLGGSWPSIRSYYLRRIFRILPGYYVTLLLIILFFHPEFLNINHWRDLWAFLTFTMSLNLSSQVNVPFWTLAIEFQFYLLLPVIAWLFSLIVSGDKADQRMYKLTVCLLVLVSWGVVTRYVDLDVAKTGPIDSAFSPLLNALKPYVYGDTGKYFDVFAIGMFLAAVYTFVQSPAGEHWKAWMRQSNPFMLVGGVVLLVFLPFQHMTALNYGGYTLTSSFSDPHIPLLVLDWMQWQVLGYSIGYGLCLWALLFGTAGLKRPFEGSLLRWFGSISYSLYMWHLPFMFVFIYVIVHNIHNQAWNQIAQYCLFWCWTLVVIIPISTAFCNWVEKPGVRLGERLIAATQTWGKQRSVAQVWRNWGRERSVALRGRFLVGTGVSSPTTRVLPRKTPVRARPSRPSGHGDNLAPEVPTPERRSVAQAYPSSSLHEAVTVTHAARQFKGHVLVGEIQRTASHGMPVPLSGDRDTQELETE